MPYCRYTLEYIEHFYPFEMPKVEKEGLAMRWDISGDNTINLNFILLDL